MKKSAIVIISFLAVNQLFIYGYKSIMKESQLLKADQVLNNVGSEIDYLIAGNSHALAIQTQLIGNAGTIASYGEEIHNTYFKLNYLINELNVKPKTIMLSCDLGMLKSTNIDQQNYQFYWNNYEDKRELFQFSKDKISFISNRITGDIFPYMEGEIEVFDYFFANKKSSDLARQRRGNEIRVLNNEERIVEKGCLDRQFSDLGIYYFNKIISLCIYHNISLVLIRFPVTPYFNYTSSKCFDPSEYYQILKNKYIKGHKNIMLLDYHNTYDVSKFRDSHHLKGGGVRVNLTNRIMEDLKKNSLAPISRN